MNLSSPYSKLWKLLAKVGLFEGGARDSNDRVLASYGMAIIPSYAISYLDVFIVTMEK